MANLTLAQATYIVGELSQFAATLETYLGAHAADPDVDSASLQEKIDDLNAAANNLANQAIAIDFSDSAAAYASLTNVTQQANATAASITQEVNQFSRVANIAASMIGLATALGSGNPTGVIKAVASVTSAVTGH